MDIKLNLSYYASIMLDAFIDLLCSNYAGIIGLSLTVFIILSLGHILISDFVVTDLFINSLPGMFLLYLATHFLLQRCFLHNISLRLYDSCIAIVQNYRLA